MANCRVVYVTLPEEVAQKAEAMAHDENRSLSDLMQEALCLYERQRIWDEANRYGNARAHELGLREEDVLRLIDEYRQEAAQSSGERSEDRIA